MSNDYEKKVLQVFEEKNQCDSALEDMFLISMGLLEEIEYRDYEYYKLSNEYDNLYDTAEVQIKAVEYEKELTADTLNSVRDTLNTTTIKLEKESNRKKNWRTVALVEGGVIALITTLTILLF